MNRAGRSIEEAVLKAQPLPYQGFEAVFQRNLILNFRPKTAEHARLDGRGVQL